MQSKQISPYDPCKHSWASYAINQNFTAGIQSTQRVEVMNKIIKHMG